MFHLCKSVGRFRRKSSLNELMCYKYQFVRHNGDEPPWKLIFYGTDTLSEVTLRALNVNRYMHYTDYLVLCIQCKM